MATSGPSGEGRLPGGKGLCSSRVLASGRGALTATPNPRGIHAPRTRVPRQPRWLSHWAARAGPHAGTWRRSPPSPPSPDPWPAAPPSPGWKSPERERPEIRGGRARRKTGGRDPEVGAGRHTVGQAGRGGELGREPGAESLGAGAAPAGRSSESGATSREADDRRSPAGRPEPGRTLSSRQGLQPKSGQTSLPPGPPRRRESPSAETHFPSMLLADHLTCPRRSDARKGPPPPLVHSFFSLLIQHRSLMGWDHDLKRPRSVGKGLLTLHAGR